MSIYLINVFKTLIATFSLVFSLGIPYFTSKKYKLWFKLWFKGEILTKIIYEIIYIRITDINILEKWNEKVIIGYLNDLYSENKYIKKLLTQLDWNILLDIEQEVFKDFMIFIKAKRGE